MYMMFMHFTVCHNAHLILILLIQFSWFAIRRLTIVLDRLPYSRIFTIRVKLTFLYFLNLRFFITTQLQ